MTISKDLTGQVFGKLTVIDKHLKPIRNRPAWKCKCYCGKTKIIKEDYLLSGKDTDCKECRFLEPSQKFGKLTIISKNKEKKSGYYDCLCECGNNKTFYAAYLLSGYFISCGCVKNKIDLRGRKFGKLTVIELTDEITKNGKKDEIYWNCSCECGKTKVLSGLVLLHGKKKSCGCYAMSREDLTGQKFGKLTLIKRVENDKRNWPVWECKCDCGNITNVSTVKLNTGHTKSCGCLNLPGDQRLLAARFEYSRRYNDGDLTYEEFYELSQKDCNYCGKPPSNGNEIFKWNGLDRVDSKFPHNKNNVVSCCMRDNTMKSNRNVGEFIGHILQSAAYLCAKNRENKEIFNELFKIFKKKLKK
jgi:hypothetical protein